MVHAFSRPGRQLIRLPGLAWLREIRWPVASAILDGEAVAGDGSEGIQAVFEARHRPGSPMAFTAFDATFVAEPGKPVSGHAAIREVMAGFVASKPRIEMTVPIVVQSGDLALTVSEYTITSRDPTASRPPVPLVGRR